jgi:hypothetical protein
VATRAFKLLAMVRAPSDVPCGKGFAGKRRKPDCL